jgi:hypothetical protein
MSEHVVRGFWLTGGIKFMRTQYPADVNERLLGALPRPLRASLADIQPVQWYARSHHAEMLNAIVSAHRDETSAFESLIGYGQLVAGDIASGALRPLMQILTPKLLAKKLPQMWAGDHQADGALEVDTAQVDDGRLLLKLSHLQNYPHVGVVTLGWIKGFLTSLGRRDVTVKQTGWSLGQAGPSELNGEVRWS